MPVEAKPLFRPDALQPVLKAFQVPEDFEERWNIVRKWSDLLWSQKADEFKEQELLADFLNDIFTNVLGYERPSDNPDRYTISREKYNEVDGNFADAVIGEFVPGQPDKFTIALEGKGPKDPLDRPFAGRKKSAVDQGYGYAINLPSDWIIVTSMRETRLYHKGSDQQTFEQFRTDHLAERELLFRKFLFLLGAERVVPAKGHCHFYKLKEASEKIGETLTKNFYVKYADIRQEVFEMLCEDNRQESRHEILAATQKVLDRVLFTAFCEDRGLLPAETLKQAFEHKNPYDQRPIWENFRGLFRSIDAGNPELDIPPYNGGLFADDAFLEKLQVRDAICGHFHDLGEYEYRPPAEVATQADTDEKGQLIDVEILGHIFEQSITDLEKIRNELDGLVEPAGKEKHKTRRKKEGAFYTPSFITRYIVEQTLGAVLEERFERLRERHHAEATATAKTALQDPRVYELDKLTNPARTGLIRFWEAWQDELMTIRILDPACGSGAFLIEAFDQLHETYRASNDQLEELRGHRSLLDLDRRILQNNLYGVDLNEEAIQICRLSLWIKTAERGKTLTSLDETIRVGNSVVDDPAVHPKAFRWREAFPEVFADGGFDVVVANPPYIRQEWFSKDKPYLEANYRSYHGMADLYVYFYEVGLRNLKPGGLMSYIVTNKWMKAGYGKPLRQFFKESAWVESVVDFGHAKQIFPDADVFPSIIVARKPTESEAPETARLCTIPRDQLRIDDLSRQIEMEGAGLPLEQLNADSWQLEPQGVTDLLKKLNDKGIALTAYSQSEPLRGILTGLNEAFLIEHPTRQKIITVDAASERLIRRNLRGQDFERWSLDWTGFWLICIASSENKDWPWSNSGDDAEKVFRSTYPGIYAHLEPFRDKLIKRQDQGRYWWELRSCAYWAEFDRPKIMYPEITWRAQWGIDRAQTVCNNTAYILPSDDLWILAVANAPITWWYSWRTAMHGKDEALRFIKDYVQTMPIPQPTGVQRESAEQLVLRLIEIAGSTQSMHKTMLDWLRVEYDIHKSSRKLQSLTDLDSDEFVSEVKRIRGRKNPLSAAALKSLRDEYGRTITPARVKAAEALKLERQLSDMVNEAYGLTPQEVDLMWKTAPPRMPIQPATTT